MRPSEPPEMSSAPAGDDHTAVLRTAYNGAVTTKDAAVLLAETAADGARATHQALRHQIACRPWTTLGVAAGVGFVVAGGFSSPAVWGLARVGARFALASVARHLTSTVLDAEARTAPASSARAPESNHTDNGFEVA